MASSKMTALVSVMDLPFPSGPILLEFLPRNGVRGLYFQGGCIFSEFYLGSRGYIFRIVIYQVHLAGMAYI